MKTKIEKIIDNIKKPPDKEKDKKALIKEINKINNRLTSQGMKLLRMETELENDPWYCFVCTKKQPVKMVHLLEHRNREKMFAAKCSVCDTDLLKKKK